MRNGLQVHRRERFLQKIALELGLEGFSTGINEKNGIFSYILMFNIFHNLKVKENPVFPHQNVE